MKKTLCFILTSVALLSFAACQVTPDQLIVVGKDQERMIEAARETLPPEKEKLPLTQRYNIKEHIAKQISELDDKLTIEVNADVVVPATDKLSITHVQPTDFSQETVRSLFQALCGETVMYMPSELTKKDIEYCIIKVKKEREECANRTDQLAQMDYEQLGKVIEDYEKQYLTAPDDVQKEIADGTLETREYEGKNFTSFDAYEFPGRADLLLEYGKEGKAFSVSNNFDITEPYEEEMRRTHTVNGEIVTKTEKILAYPSYCAMLEYSDYRYYKSWDMNWNAQSKEVRTSCDLSKEELSKVGISPEAAEAMAQVLFTQAQIPFTVQDISYIPAESPFYALSCSRQVNGANLVIGGEGTGGDGVCAYWANESLSLCISGQGGIIGLSWISPYEVTADEVESATLLPFDSIENIFYTMMKTIYVPRAKEENKTVIDVSKVSLQLARIKLKDSDKEALLTPVWCFYGKQVVDERVKNEGMISDWQAKGYTNLLVVNAIDGSIIDMAKGY